MVDSVVIQFAGRLSSSEHDPDSVVSDSNSIVDFLDKMRFDIANDIRKEIQDIVEGRVQDLRISTTISFAVGSVTWNAIVEFVSHGWPAIEALAAVGGVIGLCESVSRIVSSVVSSYLTRFISFSPRPYSVITTPTSIQVLSSHSPSPSSGYPAVYTYPEERWRRPWLGIAACLAGAGLLSAGLAVLVYAFRH